MAWCWEDCFQWKGISFRKALICKGIQVVMEANVSGSLRYSAMFSRKKRKWGGVVEYGEIRAMQWDIVLGRCIVQWMCMTLWLGWQQQKLTCFSSVAAGILWKMKGAKVKQVSFQQKLARGKSPFCRWCSGFVTEDKERNIYQWKWFVNLQVVSQ